MKITVTQSDIDHGKRGDCLKCPISRPINRKLKRGAFCKVYDSCVYFRFKWETVYCDLAEEAQHFISLFDREPQIPGFDSVNPFSFNLDIPEAFLK